MKLAVPKATFPGERRVSLVPESVKKLVKAGLHVAVQTGAGLKSGIPDSEYSSAGATIEPDVGTLLGNADIVLAIHGPTDRSDAPGHEVDALKDGAILLATLQPTTHAELVRKLTARKITAFSTDCIPRITRAQAMDTLSSQASLAGYKAVIIAANELGKIFPMMMTAAGTIVASRVFVIGAGVAGLQAIATAKRLGATIEAFDTRPVVKEQVESLGAKFVMMDLPKENAQDAGGYAKQMSEEFYRKQGELMGKHVASADVVITTALIGGVQAPKLITEDMVRNMRPGSVIVDVAADGGGNCVLTEPGQTVEKHGVTICGPTNLASSVPVHASQTYSRNVTSFVLTFIKDGAFTLDLNDEIQKGAIVTHAGEVLHAATRSALSGPKAG